MAAGKTTAEINVFEKSQNTTPSAENASLHFVTVGVWTIMTQRESNSFRRIMGWIGVKSFKQLTAISLVVKFLMECYRAAAPFMIVYLMTSIWNAIEPATELYFSSRFLDLMQSAISTGKLDGYNLAQVVGLRLAFMLMNAVMSFLLKRSESILSMRIRYFFEERTIHANLRLDLCTAQDPDISEKFSNAMGSRYSPQSSWRIFEQLIHKLTQTTSFLSQIAVLFDLARSQKGGGWFMLICLASSLFEIMSGEEFSETNSYIWASNPFYCRMQALVALVTGTKHRMEIISDSLSDYISSAWRKARESLGDASDDWPESLLYYQRPIHHIFFAHLATELPLIFYACQIFRSPTSFSLSSIALMEQTMKTLTWTLRSLLTDSRSFLKLIEQVNDMNNLHFNLAKDMVDGSLSYPGDKHAGSRGMSFQFKDVSFKYPKSDQEVLKNMSFSITAGQAVVIVGSNGSGKSTLLKLLNRLYDPTTGTIELDGIPLTAYKSTDVRQAMAMMYQTYTHYPLSIKENIILGRPDRARPLLSEATVQDKKSQAAMEDAAKQGGSFDFVMEKTKGFDTVLRPEVHGFSTARNPSPEFKAKMNEVSKQTDVSAGQWQRLALSRLFFRASSKDTRLVAADEPSASLDPKMENQLFERLRSLSTSEGKTMIYVTHRFGYLTKHADLILVLQNGELVEQGKHSDLLAKNGEYAKLYKLQADAFLEE